MSKKPINIMCTAFRDGFQSCYGARVFTEDFMPAVAAVREAGVTHFEAGGGARFQSLYFYCNEDAFAMMDRFREVAGPDANLQTLARGVNVVGLDSQPRDIIKLHAKLFKKHGISSIRNFDALNDVNNLIDSGQAIHDAGLKHEVVISMMELPPGCSGAHTAEFYIQTLRQILDAKIPYDSVCFKDASGTSVPSKIYDTIKQARKLLGNDINIVFHSHETAGIGTVGYIAAIEAGASQVDCSLAPMSGGTCQPDIATLWHALRGSDYELDIDIDKIMKAALISKECMKDYFLPPEACAVEPLIPWSPMPGGALTANTQMLRDNNLMDKYTDCIAAMGEVVRLGGFGTSVTPVSQFYFQQAFNNVLFGKWNKIAEGYGKMVLGYFGKTPCAPDPEIVKLASKQLNLEPTTEKVVDINDRDPSKGVESAKKLLRDSGITDLSDENIFIAATCKDQGIQFLKGEGKVGVRKNAPGSGAAPAAKSAGGGYTVTVNGKAYGVKLSGDKATVNGKEYAVNVAAGLAKESAAPAAAAGGSETEVKASVPGTVLRISVSVGDSVSEGDELMALDVMKMETAVTAPCAGSVKSVLVSQSDKVNTGDLLVTIG
ncbi:MAG: biotin/lipoyl-binding protein [Kiritimatiellae bacterium]|nr:biotin/lipoyl-binding protein [Kiritimatiellia bacterium]